MKIENIKFKAKKTLDGKWIKGDLVHHKDSDSVWITDYENQLTSPVDPSTICQFTGLKDCDGKEVWEGDIIEFYDRKHTIVWSQKEAAYILVYIKDDKFWNICGVLEFAPFKVVGNKFDKEK